MASPFSIFRKHQKQLTVVLTGLAMFAFIVMDAIGRMSDPTALIPLLSAVVFAAAFWMWGAQTEKRGSMALTGLLVGAVVGIIPVILRAGQDGISTSVGTISRRELYEMKQKRQTANDFIRMAFSERENPMGFFLQQYMFGGGTNQEMVTKYLLLHEADRLNVHINNEYITNYILEASDGKLRNRKRFLEIRRDLNVGESEIYEILRDELRARVAYQLLRPRSVQMPEQYWQDFRKVNVRYTVDATAIPVEPFAAKLKTPAPGKVEELFNQFKAEFPLGDKPGFRQPERKQLAWFEFAYDDFESQVGEIPQEEIDKRYEERKAPDLDVDNDADGETGDLGKDLFGPTDGGPDGDGSSKPESGNDSVNEGNAPKLPDPPDQPGSEDSPANPDEPEGDESKDGDAGSSTPDSGNKKPTPGDSTEDSKAEPEPDSQSDCFQDDAAAEPQPEPNADKGNPPATEPAAESAEPPEQGDKPNSKETPGAAPLLPDNVGPKGESAGEASSDRAASPEPPPLPESKSSVDEVSEDELLREQIHDEIKREKTEALLKERIDDIRKEFQRIVSDLRDRVEDELDEKDKEKPAPDSDEERVKRREQREAERDRLLAERITKAARKLAKDKGLVYRQTDPLSFSELLAHEEFIIGNATEPASAVNPFAQPQTVAQRLFGGTSPLFVSYQAEDISRTRYLYWSTRQIAEHVPETIKEDGVQEQVERAWRLIQARPDAEKRAEEVAELVRKALGKKTADGELPASMTIALASESVTGEPLPKRESSDDSGNGAGGSDADDGQEKDDASSPDNPASDGTPDSKENESGSSTTDPDEPENNSKSSENERPDDSSECQEDEPSEETEADTESAKNDDDSSGDEAADDETGEAAVNSDGPMQLSVIANSSFSWLRQSFRGMQMNPFAGPTVEFGSIPGIDNINDEFMKTVSELKIGEVKVVPNADRSVFYVVHLKSRNPSDSNDPAYLALQRQFLREDVVTSGMYRNMAGSRRTGVEARWHGEFLRRFQVNLDSIDRI